MKHTLLIVAMVVIGLVAGAGWAQQAAGAATGDAAGKGGVALRPVFKKGETFAYEFTVDAAAKATGADGATSAETKTRHTGTIRLNVLDVDAEGIASMSAVLAKIDVRMETKGSGGEAVVRQVAFTHPVEGAEEAEPAPASAPAAAEDGAAAEKHDAVKAVAQALSRAVIRFEMTAAGHVKRVSGLDAAAEAAAMDAETGALAMGVFAPASVARMLERLWLMDGPREGTDAALPESWPARGAGEEWTLRDERVLQYGEVATISRQFTLGAAGVDGKWPVAMRAEGKLPGKRADPDPTVPKLMLKEWKEEGSAAWDAAAGRIASRKEKVVTETAATLGARSRGARLELEIEVKAGG